MNWDIRKHDFGASVSESVGGTGDSDSTSESDREGWYTSSSDYSVVTYDNVNDEELVEVMRTLTFMKQKKAHEARVKQTIEQENKRAHNVEHNNEEARNVKQKIKRAQNVEQ